MFEKILSGVARCLERHDIPYMIIGGQAVLLHGEPRLTRDIDVTLGVNTDRLDNLIAAIEELPLRPLPEDIMSFVGQTMVLPAVDEASGIRVDFIFSFMPYEAEAIRRATKVMVLDQGVSFAAPEDIVVHKIFAGRPRDIEDARSILLKNPEIDLSYIRDWLKEFDAASDEKEFVRTFEGILKTLEM